MYSIWTKLTLIEEVLLGEANEVVDYLQKKFYSPIQQIRSMFRERAKQLTNNALPQTTNDSIAFRILPESDSPFDSVCDYVGFILHSYDKKSDFPLNGQHYKRGDILIKAINNVPNSSKILKSGVRNPEVYNNLYKSLLNWYFKKDSCGHFFGLGIIYEESKWKFNAFIIGSESMRSSFSLEERRLLEMHILTWTKNIINQKPIRENARQMLDEQLTYVKNLLETQRPDMENLWASTEIDFAIKIFEQEIQDGIDALFQPTPVFNTFANLRDQIQSKDENKLKLLAEIFENYQLTLKTPSFEPSLYQIWKQLKSVENWLENNDFNSLVNFLQFNTFVSIESLFSIPIPPFLDQLGICPESDPFDSTLDYIGLLIYHYNNEEEFIIDKHRCKRGQLLICQKENLKKFPPAPEYKQISFAPIFFHEYLYRLYFNKTPDELFQGIGFVYEQGQWKFDVITYAGIHGIHSIYDTRGENQMASSIHEQHCMDLVLSTLYMNNKWLENLGCMYSIDELESIERDSIRAEIERIEEEFQRKETELASFNDTCCSSFKNLMEQYKPKPSLKPLISKSDNNAKRSSFQEDRESINNPKDDKILTDSDSKQTSKCSTLEDSTASLECNQHRTSKRPKAFPNFSFRRRSSSQDSSSTVHTSRKPTHSIDHLEQTETSLLNSSKSHQRDSIAPKTKDPISLYQLWRELCDAEQKIFHNPDLNEFITYLTKKDYLNYSLSIRSLSFDDKAEEYSLMAKIKIDAQLKFVSELFLLKKSKLLQQKSNQEKKQLDELFKTFENHYTKQIEIAKKSSK